MSGSRVSADERREQLIDATIDLMRCTGVQSLTLRAIAKEAGAPLATVHYCFRSKEELIYAAITRWLSNMLGYAQSIPVEHGLRAAVLSFTDVFWNELEKNPDDVHAQLELVIWAARQEDSAEMGELIYPGYARELSTIFERAYEVDGREDPLDGSGFVRALLVIIDGCSLQLISQPSLPGHREQFDFLVQSLLDHVLPEQGA